MKMSQIFKFLPKVLGIALNIFFIVFNVYLFVFYLIEEHYIAVIWTVLYVVMFYRMPKWWNFEKRSTRLLSGLVWTIATLGYLNNMSSLHILKWFR